MKRFVNDYIIHFHRVLGLACYVVARLQMMTLMDLTEPLHTVVLGGAWRIDFEDVRCMYHLEGSLPTISKPQ